MGQLSLLSAVAESWEQAIASPRVPAPHFPLTSEADRAGEYAFRYGRCYDAYLVAESGWKYFWSSGRRGVVALASQGRYRFSSGGLLAPEEHREELLAQLIQHAAAHRQVLGFFNIPEDQLPLFRAFGFQATKWGEEAIVDLPDCTWVGKSYEWVRRQSNFCLRHGLTVSECRRGAMSAIRWQDLIAELAEVSALFLATKPQANEMRFLQGGFDPTRLGKKRVFVARAAEGTGRIEGFLACNPCEAGKTWVMETFRRRPDAVRGTNAFLVHQVMQQLQAEGVQHASLCLLPGLRCREPLPGDSALARWGLVLGIERFNLVFDTAGAYHFKSRFRPRFENRYLCVRPRMSLGAALAFIRLLGVLKLDAGKLVRNAVRRWCHRDSRASLPTPGQ